MSARHGSRFSLSVLVLALLVVAPAFAGEPVPTARVFPVTALDAVDTFIPEPLDLDAALAEGAQAEAAGEAPRFAVPYPVQITLQDYGTWERLPGGLMLWRLRIVAPGAKSLNLAFGKFRLSANARLFLYSGDGKRSIRPFTADDNRPYDELWTPVLPGDDLVVELTAPEREIEKVKLELTSINQGYRGFGVPDAVASGGCNMDIACLDGLGSPWAEWRQLGQATANISTGGSAFCTGSLLNNTAQDRKMLFMTANHCGINSGNAASLVTYWNYENSTCRLPGSAASGGAGDGSFAQFHTGSTFKAAYSPSDFTLVEMTAPAVPAFNHYWAGWDRTPYSGSGGPGNGDHACGPATGALCAGIHHPNNDEKRITFVEQNTTTTSYNNSTIPGDGTHVHSYWDPTPIYPPSPATTIPPGVTEPGSSGSPLYNAARRFIGQLHGGPSACGATGENLSDYYGHFSVSWDRSGSTASNRVKDYLDPGNTGAMTIDGRANCTAPPVPSGLTATANGNNRIDLAWGASAGATSYKVYRAEASCALAAAFTLLQSGVVGTTYSDLTVSGSATYAYKIVAVDDAQPCESAQSTCDDATATGVCMLTPTFDGLATATSAGTTTCGIQLGWTAGASRCGGGVVYNVFRSTTPGFSPSAANLRASCVAGTGYTDTTPLPGTLYYYAVRAEDQTGNGSGHCANGNQEGNSVVKSAGASGPDTVFFADDLESGSGLWTTTGTPAWSVVTTGAHSLTHSYFALDQSTVGDSHIRNTAALALPAAVPVKLEFWHNYTFEGTSTRYDGGVLETSTDGGTTWNDILTGNSGRLLTNGYNGTLSTCCSNPLGGRSAWTASTSAWTQVTGDLADFAGSSLLLRWRIGTDSSQAAAGWWIDDVKVFVGSTCSAGLYFAHGFEAGSFAGWSATYP